MKTSALCFGLIFALAACAGSAPRKPASITPEPKSFDNLLNFPLSPGEAWKGGSKDSELAGFLANAQDVRRASARLYQDHADQNRSGRVFHEKSHGCLTGTLAIRSYRPEDPQHRTFQGLFAAPASFPVIVRFSNGIGSVAHDADPDVRGMAVKIFTGGATAVDLLMTNGTNPLGRDLQQFVDFMNAQVQGNVTTVKFVADQVAAQSDADELPYLRHFARSVLGQIEGPDLERYWGGHAYTFGPALHMKFNAQPAGYSEQDRLKYDHRGEGVGLTELPLVFARLLEHRLGRSPNYLREELKASAARGPIHYVLNVQLEKDPKSTPIENALVEWKESDAPSIPVADLVLDQQDFDRPERDQACARLRFTPAHYHPDHRPAGNMGRGRLFAYLASQAARSSDEASPDEGIVARWRAHHY